MKDEKSLLEEIGFWIMMKIFSVLKIKNFQKQKKLIHHKTIFLKIQH